MQVKDCKPRQKASMQKYEKKRQALDDEKRKRQARVETGKFDRNFKSSSQAGFYSILFSNKFTYQVEFPEFVFISQ